MRRGRSCRVLVLGTLVGLMAGPVRGQAPEPPTVVTNSIGMKLTLIPAGEFLMGSPDSDKEAYADEKPQHRVRISRPFYLGVYEVTQQEYSEVMGRNPSSFAASGRGKEKVAGTRTTRYPVEQVSWRDAVEFCNRLSVKEGLPPYYRITGEEVTIAGGRGYHLPTEAEWEYACRAGSTTRYSFGDDEARLGQFAWFNGDRDFLTTLQEGMTHPVGQKQPNGFGLFDMHGNVLEWCWDGYNARYYDESPAADPSGPLQAADRVFRGGCWIYFPRNCRSANRDGGAPEGRGLSLGFRVAQVPSSQ